MATAMMNEDLLERNIAYFKDTLLQIQCHNYNWEYQKVPHAFAILLIGDLKRILRCTIFLKENRILLLTEELDLPSRFELHECVRMFVNVSFEYKHFHGEFTISHVGHYPDLGSIAAHVNIEGFVSLFWDKTWFMNFLRVSQVCLNICYFANSTFNST